MQPLCGCCNDKINLLPGFMSLQQPYSFVPIFLLHQKSYGTINDFNRNKWGVRSLFHSEGND